MPRPSGTNALPEQEESRIQHAAEAIGVSARTLRYWEEQGLIAPSRGPGGHRRYNRHDLLIMKLIKRLLEDQGYTAGDISLLKDIVERETELALQARDDRLLLRLLLQRKAAEGYYEDLMADLGIPGPPKVPPHLPDRAAPHGELRP
ncbi:MAG: helix-turn-helix domain-containing protein [Candidatus Dormibacteraeota bacterium]|nr:helix-turn-helix domain-containing protein [Candidatus Dormibacteraeota bacterium]